MNHHYKSRLLPFIGFITYTFCMCVFALSSFLAVDSVCLKVNSSIDLMVWIWGLKTESKKIPLGRAKTKVSLWRSSSVFDVSFKNGIKDYIKVSSERRPGSSFFGCPLFNNPLRYIKSTTQKNRRAFYPDCTSTGTITRCTNLCQISAQTWNVSSNQWECKPGTRKLRERWRDTEGK